LAHAAEKAGPPIATGLWRGFKDAPIWAKVVAGGIVLKSLGLGGGRRGANQGGPFMTAGGLAAATFRSGFDAGLSKLSTKGGVIGKVATFFSGRGSTPTNPLFVKDVAGLPGKKPDKLLDVAKKVLPVGAAGAAGIAAPVAAVGLPLIGGVGLGMLIPEQPRNPNLSPHGPTRGRGPEQHGPFALEQPFDFGMGRFPTLQSGGGAWVTSPISIQIDGQEIAKVVARAAVRRASTK
jgi:hypothetical protein